MKEKIKVAFICVHNSCRSQIAEALGKHLAKDVFESYSAGTQNKPAIQEDAIRLMKQEYQIDMEKTQYPKTLDQLPPVGIVITMGCNVDCPNLPCKYREDWGLEDPSGKDDKTFLDIIKQIHEHILKLKQEIETNTFMK